MSSVTSARVTLILGVAFVFLYFGIEKFVHPEFWVGWMPSWMDGLSGLTVGTWLQIIGISEIAIGVAMLIPVRILQKIATLFATIHLIGILTQVGWNDVAVRDIGLISMTVALWFLI